MADQTTHLDTLSAAQSQKEVTANNLFDAASPSATLGRRADTTEDLTWGYYGGAYLLEDGTVVRLSNGTIALTPSATNYLMFNATGSPVGVVLSTSGWIADLVRLYQITTDSDSVTDYLDWRAMGGSGGGGGGGQPLDATLTAFAALTIANHSLTIGTGADAFNQVTFAANRFPARASTGNLEAKTITDQALALLDDSTAQAQRTTIGAAAALTSGTTITTSRAVAAGDIDKVTVVDTSGGDVVLTVDNGVFTAAEMLAGFRRSGANDLTIVAGTSTVNNPTGILAQDGDTIFLLSTAANVVSLQGDEKIRRLSAVLPTDDTFQGDTITGLVSASALTQWDAVYVTGLSRVARADADAGGSPDATAAPARGLVTTTVGGADVAVSVLTRGIVRNDAWTWTPGENIYLSGTAGGLTQTAPDGVVQPVGWAAAADIAVFDFSSGAATGTDPYDAGGGCTGVPAVSLVLMHYPFPRTVVFPSGLTSSRGVAGTAATAQADFDIRRNGGSVGTMRFAAAATTASFIMASATTFFPGDILTVVAPASPDATLADVGFALAGTRI
jgi:hypothetical protein